VNPLLSLLTAALAGSLTAYLSFAPIGWWWVPYLGFAVLAALIARAPTVQRGALTGFVFGLAYFLAGVAWVRVSMNEFGGMPLPLAWFSAFLFCAFLALYPMLAGAFTAWAKPKNPWFFAFVFASTWTFAEYLRAHLFTGFEWLSVGASQTIPVGNVFAPIFGAFGASFFVVMLAALVAVSESTWRLFKFARHPMSPVLIADTTAPGRTWKSLLVILSMLACINVAARIDWSDRAANSLRVSLLQGNVAQSMKWEPEKFAETLKLYEKLVTQAKGELIILPETALPAPLSRIPPEYIERLRGIANSKNANLIIGVPVEEKGKFYNAAISLGVEDSQQYRKVHLVPFGEYMPLRGLLAWFYANLTIPMSDFSSGGALQPNIKVNGQSLGISICYEDAFARDVHRTLRHAAGEHQQRRLVWSKRRGRATFAALTNARHRVCATHAARQQHGHHRSDRRKRPRHATPRAIHRRHPRNHDSRPQRFDALFRVGRFADPADLPRGIGHRCSAALAARRGKRGCTIK
jgi:apolipoprotein N-acyltransferase